MKEEDAEAILSKYFDDEDTYWVDKSHNILCIGINMERIIEKQTTLEKGPALTKGYTIDAEKLRKVLNAFKEEGSLTTFSVFPAYTEFRFCMKEEKEGE